MSELRETQENVVLVPMFNLAFRPMFLLATIFSILALILWGLTLADIAVIKPYGGVHFWHAHEMVFGFVSAILAGFLLTAGQNWTGLRAPHGVQLIILVNLWILARVLMLFGESIPFGLMVLVDLSFTTMAAFFLFQTINKQKQYPNYFAVLALLLIAFCNGLTHFSLHTETDYSFTDGLHATVLVITMMMVRIGGRVIPMFTANATKVAPHPKIQWLEKAILINLWALIIIYIANLAINAESVLFSIPFFSCAALIVFRSCRWRFLTITKLPLLWSLHLSYWFIPVGLMYIGLHHLYGLNISWAIHILTVGAMGGMIISMMSRVLLGHTGSPIKANGIMVYSFLAVTAATIVRVAFVMSWPESALLFLWVSIILWILGYSLFVIKFSSFLVAPRLEGKTG